uniref:C2H2-type domain-containing protein n=1 Tax=Anopheles epiroticus TaxID=199890 RepID=A0A182PR76_9DIPT
MALGPEVTLHLECWRDELSPAQTAAYQKAEKEHNEIRNKLKEIVQETGGKNIFSGQVFTAYQVLGPVPGIETISKPVTALIRKKPSSMSIMPPALAPFGSGGGVSSSPDPSPSGRRRTRRLDLSAGDEAESVPDIASDDVDEDYIPLAKRMKQKDKEKTPVKKTREEKVKTPDPKLKTPKSTAMTAKVAAISVRPNESNSIGGLQVGAEKDKKKIIPEPSAVVDLTKEDSSKPSADSREISFSKIQGKTFPSLVVLARPSLRVVDKAVTDRPQLDAKVKNVLVHPAPKFTEWLIQQGLIKSEQTCQIHNDKPLKLGMYSDTSKFPYSGGYFWISDCCPTRFTSVFHGSLFEGSPHPPSVILKLIYHWACQTNVSNVVNWVKVDNLYLKGFYTLLRSVCTLALCRHMKLLGGPKKSIEIGVISLGTTTQDGQQRQVKVEVLGVLDPEAKILRLRAVEPLLDAEKSYKKRFSKILEPLSDWVNKESIILTDLTVDKGTLNNMGYKTVMQVPASEQTAKTGNANVMDYLRRIVPRMFQNTLSLLSRQIIQQFLNELVWREMYGNSPGSTFDNIVKHLSEEAKIETKESLLTRLHKAAADPFKQWEIVADIPSAGKTPAKRGRKPKDHSLNTSTAIQSVPDPAAVQLSAAHPDPPKKIILKKVKNEEEMAAASSSAAQKRRIETEQKDNTVQLESHYYGCIGGLDLKDSALPCPDFAVPCPECPALTFRSNIDLLNHLLEHANPAAPSNSEGEDTVQCETCLEHVSDKEVYKHKVLNHPQETKSVLGKTYSCLICEQRFSTVAVLDAHMQKSHLPLEMPYRCAGCDFQCSVLRTTIEHFYEHHKGTALLQCPFCLQMCCAYRMKGKLSSPLMKNVQMFLAHLGKHKMISKRCSKCALSFLSKAESKFHYIFSHVPNRSDGTVKSVTNSVTIIPKPKKKVVIQTYRLQRSTYRIVKQFNNLSLSMKSGCICCECGKDFDEFYHIIGKVQCIMCAYQTLCLPSMVKHSTVCCIQDKHPTAKMSQEMHCKCGFSSYDGYGLARHLVACDRNGSVYSTVQAAQANVVERNMLDMLGLVRRDEDEDPADSAVVLEGQEGIASSQDPEPSSSSKDETVLNVSFSHQESADGELATGSTEDIISEGNVSGVAYDPSQSLYNIAGTGEQQFNTQLSFDDLGPPSVLPAQENDRTPQLKDDYQSLATPRVPEHPDF